MLQPMGDCANTLGQTSFLFSLMVNEPANDGKDLRAYAATLTNVAGSISVPDTVVIGKGRSTGTTCSVVGWGMVQRYCQILGGSVFV